MVPDMRPVEEITADNYAYARAYGRWHLVRGIDRFAHLPTREPAAMVWINQDGPTIVAILAPVALDDIRIYPAVVS